MTLTCPLLLSLWKPLGMRAQLPMKSLLPLTSMHVQGNSPGLDSACARPGAIRYLRVPHCRPRPCRGPVWSHFWCHGSCRGAACPAWHATALAVAPAGRVSGAGLELDGCLGGGNLPGGRQPEGGAQQTESLVDNHLL